MIEVATRNQLQRTSLSACAQCKKRHVACDFERPCSRCKDRNIECTEAEHKKRGPKFRKTAHVYPEPAFQLEENPSLNSFVQSISSFSPIQLDFFTPTTPSSISTLSPSDNLPQSTIFPSSDNLNLVYQQLHQTNQSPQNDYFSFQAPTDYSSSFQWDSNSSYSPPDNSSATSSPFSPSTNSSPLNFFTLNSSSDSFSSSQDQMKVNTAATKVYNILDIDHMENAKTCEVKMMELGIKPTKQHGKCGLVDRVTQLKKFLTPDQLQHLRQEFDRQLKVMIDASNELEFPIVIWAAGGVIAHVNAAFREVTGWTAEVPTKPEAHALFQIISKKSLVTLTKVFPRLMTEELRRFSFELAFKRYGTEGEEYIAGTAAFSVKRDMFGLPQLFHCQFIPSETLFCEEEEEDGEDLSPPTTSSPLSNSQN